MLIVLYVSEDLSLTEVSSRPGSPIDERQDMSNLPRGMIEPGAWGTGTTVLEDDALGVMIYTY